MTTAAARSAQPDLLSWPYMAQAEARVRAAEAARDQARRRAHGAPKGELKERLRDFQEATDEALRAEIALADLVRDGPPR